MSTELIQPVTPDATRPVVSIWNAQWPVRFTAEADRLRRTLGTTGPGGAMDVQHIGGTAVMGLAGSDTIDMLLITPNLATFDARLLLLTEQGYRNLGDDDEPSSQRKLALGLGQEIKVVLYVYQPGDRQALHHLLVRDYLRSYPAERDSYSALKMQLASPQNASAAAKTRATYASGKRNRLNRLLEQATGRR